MRSSLEEKASNLIKNIDYFGASLPFRLNGRSSHSSLLGGIIFLIFIVVTLAYGLYNFYVFVSYNNYKIVHSETKTFLPKSLNLTDNNITIAVGVTINGQVNLALLQKYFKIKIYYKENDNAKKSTRTEEIKLNKYCTKDDFAKYNITAGEFNQFSLDKFYCPNISQYNISGQFVNDFFSYIRIHLELVDLFNDKDLMDAYQFFIQNDIKLQLFFDDVNFSIKDYDNNKKYNFNSQFINVDFSFYKKMNLFFSMTQVFTDYNPILSSYGVESRFVDIKNVQEYFQDLGLNRFNLTYQKVQSPSFNKAKNYNEKLNVLAIIYLRASEFSKVTYKTYYKFTEMIADTIAIMQIILLLFFIVINAINEFKAVETLVTKTMKFKGSLEDNDNVDFNEFSKVFKQNSSKKLPNVVPDENNNQLLTLEMDKKDCKIKIQNQVGN